MTDATAVTPALRVIDARKSYGAVVALGGVSLHVEPGEVLALLGDNGAGKSTLIKALSGVHQLTSGAIEMNGQPVTFKSPTDARAVGIETVFQNLAVFDNLSPAGNFFIGREKAGPKFLGPFGWMRERAMATETRELLSDLQIHLPSMASSLGVMSGGQRQAIAVARAVAFSSNVVILDEPTAALGVRETHRVWDLILRLKSRGTAVILVSHNLDEVITTADRAVVLRQGRTVGSADAVEGQRERIVSLIVSGTPEDDRLTTE